MTTNKFNNPGIQRWKEIRKICKCLDKRVNVPHFIYQRIYKDGSRSVLSSNPEYVLCNYLEIDLFKHIYTPQYYYKYKYVYAPAIKNKIQNSLIKQINRADVANEFVILNQHNEFHELFVFASHAEEVDFLNHCINNISNLHAFSTYFTSEASELIKEAVSDPIIQPWVNECYINKPLINFVGSQSKARNNKIQFKYNGKIIYLTNREVQCSGLIIKGKTCKEIAKELKLSPRTVEVYIQNLKDKFSCRSKSMLIECLFSLIHGYD